MSMGFKIKMIIAWIFDLLGISEILLDKLCQKYDNQYIRIVNYHDTSKAFAYNFEKQLKWYTDFFSNISYEEFNAFMSGKKMEKKRPGLMITFDDGYKGNYDVAFPLLEKYGFTGYFMCSSDLVNTDGYMTYKNLSEIVEKGHVIGDHTATHHRMLETDSEELLKYEIMNSKKNLELGSRSKVDIFCWCGGEEEHYTRRAQEMINRSGYKYGFMTNSEPITHETNLMQLQRTNIEDSWTISLVKLQICGFMDKRFEKKRNRVNKKLSTA